VQCPGETFCCRPGTNCSRDAAGNAACLDPTGVTLTPNTGRNSFTATPTPGINGNNNNNNNGNNNNNNNNNSVHNDNSTNNYNSPNNIGNTNNNNSPNNIGNTNNNSPNNNGGININSGTIPQVAVTSGLMVTIAFLTAFLVSLLTFSHKISPDPTLHPALGFCSWTVQLGLFFASVLELLSRSSCRNHGVQCASLSAPIVTASCARL